MGKVTDRLWARGARISGASGKSEAVYYFMPGAEGRIRIATHEPVYDRSIDAYNILIDLHPSASIKAARAYLPAQATDQDIDKAVQAALTWIRTQNTRRNQVPIAPNPSSWDNQRRQGSEVQAVIFDAHRHTLGEARAWLRRHAYDGLVPDHKRTTIRFRQRDPSDYWRDSFRTIPMGENTGIQAIVAIPNRK